MPPEDRVRILHMIEATETVLNFITGRQRADFNSDRMLLFAVVRAIEVIGEAAGRVSEATRGAAADIPWSLIVSMRNRLIHAYFDVDNDVVWKAATEELPALLPKLRGLAGERRARAARAQKKSLITIDNDAARLIPSIHLMVARSVLIFANLPR
jgi:uncharacterized protein with HEPN domain